MALLNEILGGMSVDEGDFSREWMEVFGDTEEGTSVAPGRTAEASQQKESSFFLPSQLLDQSLNNLQSSLSGQAERWQIAPKSSLTVKRESFYRLKFPPLAAH